MTPEEQAAKISKIMGVSAKAAPSQATNFPSSEKILAIQMHFEDRPDINFDLSFVNNMEDRLAMGRELSTKQEAAVDNILESWKIKVSE